jgi:hypothetical protein
MIISEKDIIDFQIPTPIPKEWEKIVNQIMSHAEYEEASKGRGFGGVSVYRREGVLNHVISHYFIVQYHKDNGIPISTDITWTRPDYFDLLVKEKYVVQIKSKADRRGLFNMDWAMEIPYDHYHKYLKDPRLFGFIFGVTDFKHMLFKIIGYIQREDFDNRKRLAEYDYKLNSAI